MDGTLAAVDPTRNLAIYMPQLKFSADTHHCEGFISGVG